MDRNDFTNELKMLLTDMSEEEIREAIGVLSECKTAIAKRENREKGEKAGLLSTAEHIESNLRYAGKGCKEGTVKVLGATVLSIHDFDDLHGKLASAEQDNWWLYDGYITTNTGKYRYRHRDTDDAGKIRPVLIIDSIEGALQPGEFFCINDEEFKLVTSAIAIRTECLNDSCTCNTRNYSRSILKFCIDGWYMNLIKRNKQAEKEEASAL